MSEAKLYNAHEVAIILADAFGMIALAILMATMNGCLIYANCRRLVRTRVALLVGSNF